MKTIPKRVPEKQASVIDFMAEQEDETFAYAIKRVINASPVFKQFQQKYELSENSG